MNTDHIPWVPSTERSVAPLLFFLCDDLAYEERPLNRTLKLGWTQRQDRRAFLKFLVTGTAGMSLLAACGGASTPPPASATNQKATGAATTAPAGAAGAATTAPAQAAPAQKAAGATSSVRLHIRSGPYNDVWTKVGEQLFTPKFSNVQLKFEPYPAGELTQKVETMASAGTIGDLYFTNTYMMDHQRLGALGVAKAIDDYAKRDTIKWDDWFKVAVDQLYANGKLYGMLDGASPGRAGLYYSKDAFEAAGVPEPDETWTLDKLVDVGTKFTKDGGFAFKPTYGLAPETLIWLRAFGGDVYSKDGKKATLTTPESRKGLDWLYQGTHKLKIFPKPDQMQDGISTLFAAKKLAMFNSGTWDANMANSTKVKWGLAPLPKGPTGVRGSMAEANTICLTTASKNPDMAWEFAKMDASRDGGIFHLDLGVTPGGRPDVYGDPKVQQQYFWMKVWSKVWEEALPFGGPANFRGSEASDTLKQGLDPLWLGSSAPDGGAVDKTNDAIQKILDKTV